MNTVAPISLNQSTSSKTKWVLPRGSRRVREKYILKSKLGQGQFGITYLCIDKITGKKYACKCISKRKLLCQEDFDDVWREIQIMHHLSDHPNMVKIEGEYEDAAFVYLVMELCEGGELFDRIIKKGHYSEREAAKLIKIIVNVVGACHSSGVMHRDLKPENFLFLSTDEDSPLMATDFGLSAFYKSGDIFCDVVGSPYYVAPEVLRKSYGIEADVWSAGVILYILLCGVPPFWAESERGIFQQILQGALDFESEPWPNISESAKDLVRRMLERNPKKRLTASEVLSHPWIMDVNNAPDKPLDSAVLSRLKHFSAMNKLKKLALRIDRSGKIPLLRFRDRESYASNKTKEYDDLAMKYLSYVLFFLVACFSVYSLMYERHKSWYSWILSSLTSCVYMFGFVMMCPQLFINYKLKSVAHLPWRQMTYKFLNTIIDDLFAFVIKMPTLHRLSVFRDDIIFLIYLYQRWVYPVDRARVNEFGFGGEENQVAVADVPRPEQKKTN